MKKECKVLNKIGNLNKTSENVKQLFEDKITYLFKQQLHKVRRQAEM